MLIKKKKKMHHDIALLANTNFDCITDFISRSLTDTYNERNYFNLIDVIIKYDYMKEEINKLET